MHKNNWNSQQTQFLEEKIVYIKFTYKGEGRGELNFSQ